MIRRVPLSSSRLSSGTRVLIRWVFSYPFFFLNRVFCYFMQLEGGSSQQSSHGRRDRTEKIINSALLPRSQQQLRMYRNSIASSI